MRQDHRPRPLPSRRFPVNAVRLELGFAAIDLLARTRVLLLDSDPAAAEPRKPRHRIPYVAVRITRGGRRPRLRISTTWPWRHELAAAFHRMAAVPRPAIRLAGPAHLDSRALGNPAPRRPHHMPTCRRGLKEPRSAAEQAQPKQRSQKSITLLFG
ncbi:transposase [Streptomyces sp. NPDC021212]|uniref:transposase n=1 Tax=Streptomyces sp. NPDC021212 TaxID=3365118 RepID=UPI0037A5AFFC